MRGNFIRLWLTWELIFNARPSLGALDSQLGYEDNNNAVPPHFEESRYRIGVSPERNVAWLFRTTTRPGHIVCAFLGCSGFLTLRQVTVWLSRQHHLLYRLDVSGSSYGRGRLVGIALWKLPAIV